MVRLSFSTLKSHYPRDKQQMHSCEKNYLNTCALRMSEALVKTDSSFRKAFQASLHKKCPHGYMRRPQDLAAVLKKVWGVRDLGWVGNAVGEAPADVQEKKGIVCYMNIPSYSGQGHIDLGDETRAVGEAYWNAKTIWMWKLP